MDSSSAAAEMITLVAAGGDAVHFFPTCRATSSGNPIAAPVIKLSANPRTIRTMSEHMDVVGTCPVSCAAKCILDRGWRQAARHDVPDHRRAGVQPPPKL